jgi:sugar/nucleoside kinase (ribokinase family)
MAHILCAGIAVLDEVFRVRDFPLPDTKAEASEFITIGGGNAANAAVAIVRLGGKVSFAAPLGGPAGEDEIGDRLIRGLAEEGVDCTGCVRVAGARTGIAAIFIDARGDRTIAAYRDRRLDAVVPVDAEHLVAEVDAVLADNRFPDFVTPICRAGRARGLPVVIDVDKVTAENDPLFALGTHVIFSADSLRRTAGTEDLAAGLARISKFTDAFVAVSDGPRPIVWRERGMAGEMAVFAMTAVDTLGAGDVLHGAFTLALVEGSAIAHAMRFAAAAAGLKCARFGGSTGAPRRAEVEALLAGAYPAVGPKP